MTSLRIFLNNLINVGVAVVSFFLLARILLEFFAANSAAPFVSFIYRVSSFLLAPFQNIFGQASINGSTLDVPALFALIVYLFVGYALTALVDALYVPYARRHYTIEDHLIE